MNQTALSRVLFVGAHPDDETVMAGGTLAMLTARGVTVTVLCATDGRGGEDGGVPEAATPEGRARVRERELRCAAEALGVYQVILLGYVDPPIGPDETLYSFTADEKTLIAQIAAVIRETRAQAILTHGSDGEYGHPAHVQVHRAVLGAVRQSAPDVWVYGVAGYLPEVEDRLWNASDPAHLALDITPWFEAKHAAMLCHRTQHALFKRWRKLRTVREAVRTLETFHRHHPPVPPGVTPDDPFAATLLAAGAWQPLHSR
ncbi:MAG: 1D-myo-inositol 2-acetamido-2-deoxy-alpha-D-glucopyranoside deacetylase [Anaerolineae bacterium]|nr:MAG: 1D-myo-inositol 2-acetamido-2-deoxy-alpha-D-glucopyranoside deacetylase [Anaerolineae bacterium]